MISLKEKSFFLSILFMLLFQSCSLDDGVETIDPPNFEVIGLWDLVEVNVNPPQDLDMDGTASTNLMDEMECITGSLLIDGNLIWTFEQSVINVTAITGDLFSATCNGTVSGTGNWFSDENEVTFSGDDILSVLRISEGRLIDEVGEDLPGIQSFVYALRIPE
ncbi:MAG: hypothetical protein AAF765_12810 [Bacteroidota bacterium]